MGDERFAGYFTAVGGDGHGGQLLAPAGTADCFDDSVDYRHQCLL